MDRSALQLLDRLEATLTQSVQRQQQLVGLLQRKREAMRSGDSKLMADLCRAENAVVQTVHELEKRRQQHVAELTAKVDPAAKQPMRMLDLAERLPEPQRGRLLVTRTKLVEAMEQVQRETAVARRASEALLGHLGGLIRTIGSVAQGGAAYGQTGRLYTKPARLSSLDLAA